MPLSMTIGVVCSLGIGPSRGGRKLNEDNYLICRNGEVRYRKDQVEFVERARGAGIMLAVADGMGGHNDGGLASAASVKSLAQLYKKGWPAAPELDLHGFVLRAHENIRKKVARDGRVRMGTTLTVAWLLKNRLFWIHVGDSRLYHFRGDSLKRLTSDHTRREFANRDRRPLPPEPDSLAQSFVFGSRGLGRDSAIRIDPGRDTGSLAMMPGDRLLLCTDGLSGFLDDHWIAFTLQEVPSPAACAQVLLERAIARGSTDNITVMVARLDGHQPSGSGGGRQQRRAPGADDTLVPL